MEGWHFVMFSIVQVFVHLQSSAAVNVALGKPAYQTDTYQTDAADRAVDGNTSPDLNAGRSCAATKSFNTSWWVNLQQIFLIRSVKIFNRNDCCASMSMNGKYPQFEYLLFILARFDIKTMIASLPRVQDYVTVWGSQMDVNGCKHTGNRLTNVELYVGFSERGFQSREGFRPGEVGISHTFDLDTPVYGQWLRITRNPPVDVLTLCEVEVEGVPYSAGNGFHFSVFQGYVHTGTAIDVSKKVGSKLVCASRCSNSSNCISTHYNTATFTCSLFDSLAFKKGDVETDVCVVNSIAITNNSRAQLFGT